MTEGAIVAVPVGTHPTRSPGMWVEGLWADRGGVPVLRDVSLLLPPGRLVAILGPNGAGKSTLLLVLGGLLRARRGRVLLGSRRIDGLAAERVARLGVAHLPQGRHLFRELTVRDNLALARFAQRPGVVMDDPGLWLERFPEISHQLDIPAGLLSGGQQQLVAVVRALLPRPHTLLCDEPTAALSGTARSAVLAHLRRLASAGAAVAVVEQEVDAVLEVADRVVVMRGGGIVEVRDHA